MKCWKLVLVFLLVLVTVAWFDSGSVVLAYWDDPPNGLNLTCQICEYQSDKCDASEEELCSSPVHRCHNSQQIDRVVQSIQTKLHSLLKPLPPPARARPKYICIRIEDKSEKIDYVSNLPISRGRGAGGGGVFVGEFGEQSPQFINVVGRPNMNNPGIPAAGRGISTENLILGPHGSPLAGPGTGTGPDSPGNPVAMSPYASAVARVRKQMLQTKNEGPTPPAACDESTMNSEACNPPDAKADASAVNAAGESDADAGVCVHQEWQAGLLIIGGGLVMLLISV